MGISQNADGWTDVTHSIDSRIIYVDSANGSDTSGSYYTDGDPNWDADVGPDPFNPVGIVSAYQTLTAAYNVVRDGFPDWLLLRGGEIWSGQKFDDWRRSGRSVSERVVIGAYGGGPRPTIAPGEGETAFRVMREGINTFCMLGIRLYAETRDPNSGSYVSAAASTGINILSITADNYLFEDCEVRYFTDNVSILHNTGSHFNYAIRRCLILDSYTSGGSHSQGMFLGSIKGLLVEGNVFDHNGWYGDRDTGGIANAPATTFNHNLYVSGAGQSDHEFYNNISLRASLTGMMARWGGIILDNLVIQCPFGITSGAISERDVGATTTQVNRNVVLRGNDLHSAEQRGTGITIQGMTGAEANENVIAHDISATPTNTRGMLMDANVTFPQTNVAVSYNTFFDWYSGGVVERGDASGTQENFNYVSDPIIPVGTNIDADTAEFMDSSRNEASYTDFANSVTGSTFDEFITEVRKQSRSRNNSEYVRWSAPTINAWIREGYNIGSAPPIASSGGLVRARAKALKV